LLDAAGDEAAADVRHPVGEADGVGSGEFGHGETPGRRMLRESVTKELP
jgi:hypothetical protein